MGNYPPDDHATGDVKLADDIRIAPDAIRAGITALRERRQIYTDSNMIRVGLSMARLRAVNPVYSAERARTRSVPPEQRVFITPRLSVQAFFIMKTAYVGLFLTKRLRRKRL